MSRIPIPSHTFEEERLSPSTLTAFRCEKCQDRYPFRLLVIQDGRKVCKPNCAEKYTPTEVLLISDMAKAEAAEAFAANQEAAASQHGLAPDSSLMTGISALTQIAWPAVTYPDIQSLTIGGAGVVLTATGVGFLSTDTLTFSNTNVTAGTRTISSDLTSFTCTVTAGGATPLGTYDLLFNSNIWRNVVKCR